MAIDPKQVQAAFLEAAAATPDERSGALDRVCAGNPELRRRVERLLRALDDSGDLTSVAGKVEETGAYEPKVAHTAARANLQPGDIFAGRYKLREKLGEGGMGIVWVADQTTPVQRRIALKVIKYSDDSSRLLARFEQERQALALMDHPNIAKVLDAGVSDDGQPYFVMELIKGMPLTKYCDEAKLTPRERLELFVAVCQAVQHAHQKGVIHRDLKPSNILVGLYDGQPVPKVIDFGVAKATGPRLSEQSIYTEVGTMIGTLEYMSPEQAALNNLDIDTRSDIYALGVILYELLTGSVPFSRKELKAAGYAEMLRIIKEVEPPKPSTRLSGSGTLPSVAASRHTEPKMLARLLRGELDWIVMKCLEKDRSRRFDTANGLARDIQRYLADEVVEARPPSAGYRLRKFVRRHKGRVVAAVALAVTLVVGVAAVVAVQLQANRDLAAKNAELADKQAQVEARNKELAEEQQKVQARFDLAQTAIATFHTGVTEDALLRNDEFRELRTKLLRKAAEFYGDLGKLLEGQTDARSRKLLADGYFELGKLIARIGSRSESLAVHRKALALRRELATEPGASVETRLDVTRSLMWIATRLYDLGDIAGAQTAYEEVGDIAVALESENPTKNVRSLLADSHQYIGMTLETAGKPVEALKSYRRALAIREKLIHDNPGDANLQYSLTDTQGYIGNLLDETGHSAEGVRLSEQNLAISQKLVDDNPTNSRFLVGLAMSHNEIGLHWSNQGRQAEALRAHERGRVIWQKLVDDTPAVHRFQYGLALSYRNIGWTYTRLGRFAEAITALNKAVGICPKQVEEQSLITISAAHLAFIYTYRGQAHARAGHAAEAAIDLRHALELLAKIKTRDGRVCLTHSRSLSLLSSLGADARSGVNPHEAATFADRAVWALQEAVEKGWVNTDLREPDFDAVRNREDFQKLFAEVEAKLKQREPLPPPEKK